MIWVYFAWIICQYNRSTSSHSWPLLILCMCHIMALLFCYFHCNLSHPSVSVYLSTSEYAVLITVRNTILRFFMKMIIVIICSWCCWMRLCCDKEHSVGPEGLPFQQLQIITCTINFSFVGTWGSLPYFIPFTNLVFFDLSLPIRLSYWADEQYI